LAADIEVSGQPEPALHVYVSDPPTVLDEDLAIIQALGTAQQTVGGESPAAIIRRPGADAVHLTAYGVPCVAFGPGGRTHPDTNGASMHAFGEHRPIKTEVHKRLNTWLKRRLVGLHDRAISPAANEHDDSCGLR
jgi:acetylornithine deacetylase/succinyl-diaminopimelate desuccinylase-like protein